MKTYPALFALLLLAPLLGGGCASPRFEPIPAAPTGRGLVYIYSLTDVPVGTGLPGGSGQNHLTHNNEMLAALGPQQYLVHFPEPGTNSYGFHQNWATRGGLVGHMFLNREADPQPVVLKIESGKTYYFRALGVGLHATLLRMDESTALLELQQCRGVKLRKPSTERAQT